MAVGIAVGAIIGLLVATMLKAGTKTLQYALRQSRVLTNARKAIEGDGSKRGLLWSVRAASSATALSPDSLTVGLPANPPLKLHYSVCPDGLCESQSSNDVSIAEGVTSLSFDYYNLDANGRIMASTAPESVTLVSGFLELSGADPNQKTSGALFVGRLRNAQ
jgi:hypothetical protein